MEDKIDCKIIGNKWRRKFTIPIKDQKLRKWWKVWKGDKVENSKIDEHDDFFQDHKI